MFAPLLCSIPDLTRWLTVTPAQPTSQSPQSSTMLAHSVGPGVSLGASPPPLTLTTSSSYTISGVHKPMAPSDVSTPGISPKILDPMAYLALPWRVGTHTVYDPHISSESHSSSAQQPTLCHAVSPATPQHAQSPHASPGPTHRAHSPTLPCSISS